MSIAWNDIVTAIIAVIALGVSSFTFVYQFTLKPQLAAQLGQEIIVHYTDNSQLILAASFVFVNKGAMPTALTRLNATVWAAGSDEPGDPNLMWRQFEEVKRFNPIGGPADYRYGSSGAVKTLVIPGRGASDSYTIRLYSQERFELRSGTYCLAFRAIGGSTGAIKECKITCRLVLNEDDAKVLSKDGKESGGNVKSRIAFEQIFPSAGSRNSLFWRIRCRILRKRTVIQFESDGVWSAIPRAPRSSTNAGVQSEQPSVSNSTPAESSSAG